MLAGVTVVDDEIEDLEVVEDKRERTIGLGGGGIGTEGQLTEDGGDNGRDESLAVEHGAVSAVVHGVEGDLERDGLGGRQQGLDDEGYEGHVVDVVVVVDEAEVGDGVGRGVGDRGGDVRVEGVRDGVEHVGVHVGVDGPVGRGVVASGDEHRVPLGDGDGDDVRGVRLDIRLEGSKAGVSARTDLCGKRRCVVLTPSTSMICMS